MEKKIKKTAPNRPFTPTAKPQAAPASKTSATPVKTGEFAFGKENYRLLFIGLAFIVLGFILMIGGGSKVHTRRSLISSTSRWLRSLSLPGM
jgi:hypothetical protein